MTPPQDLTLAELKAIAKRLRSAHERRHTLAFHEVQYWISETGPAPTRHDPRKVQRALAELANNQRPRRGKLAQGPFEPLAGVYVSPTVSRTDAQTAAVVNASSKLKQLRGLADLLEGGRVERLTQHLAGRLASDSDWKPAFTSATTWLAANLSIQMPSGIISLTDSLGIGVTILVTNDLDWLFPDDWRLWAHLHDCQIHEHRCILVARKMAVPTFALLKEVGAFGLQTHQFFVCDGVLEKVEKNPATSIWPRCKALSEATDHPFIRRLEDRLDSQTPPLSEGPLTQAGFAQGLHVEERQQSGPHLLVTAAQKAGIDAGEEWFKNVQRYAVWGDYRRPRRRTN